MKVDAIQGKLKKRLWARFYDKFKLEVPELLELLGLKFTFEIIEGETWVVLNEQVTVNKPWPINVGRCVFCFFCQVLLPHMMFPPMPPPFLCPPFAPFGPPFMAPPFFPPKPLNKMVTVVVWSALRNFAVFSIFCLPFVFFNNKLAVVYVAKQSTSWCSFF